MAASKTCTRSGCDKTLKANNKKDMCSSGCLSPDAPPSVRASSTESPGEQDVLVRFRRVARALGKDPEEILTGAMRTVAAKWLEAVESAVR